MGPVAKNALLAIAATTFLTACTRAVEKPGDDPIEGPTPSPAGWSLLDTKPAPRIWHSVIHDPPRQRMIVFGGLTPDGVAGNDVWELSLAGEDRGTWARLPLVGAAPLPRYHHSAMYDPVAQRMIVFGGYPGYDAAISVGEEIWALSLDGEPRWLPLEAAGTPPPFGQSLATYDSVGHRLLVTTQSSGNPPAAAVHALSLDATPTWSVLAPITQFSALGTPPVYDPVRHRLLFFVNTSSAAFDCEIGEVWELSLGESPSSRQLVQEGLGGCSTEFTYDPVDDRMVGFTNGGGFQMLSLVEPVQFQAHPAFSTVYYASEILDADNRQIVLFGGSGPSNGIQWLDLVGETVVGRENIPGDPWPVAGPGFSYDGAGDRLFAFGGYEANAGFYGQLHVSSLAAPGWTSTRIDGEVPELMNHTQLYDADRRRLLLFGGNGPDPNSDSIEVNDLYQIDLAPEAPRWKKLSPSGDAPAPRIDHTAFLDVPEERMIVFGGRSWFSDANPPGPEWTPVRPWNDTWELSWKSGALAWRALEPQGTPPDPRFLHGMAFDADARRMFVVGGATATDQPTLADYRNDVWELDLDANRWRKIVASGFGPPEGAALQASWDAESERLLVFSYDGVWSLSLDGDPSWTFLCPPVRGPSHVGFASPSSRGVLMVSAGNWIFNPDEAECASP